MAVLCNKGYNFQPCVCGHIYICGHVPQRCSSQLTDSGAEKRRVPPQPSQHSCFRARGGAGGDRLLCPRVSVLHGVSQNLSPSLSGAELCFLFN